MELALKIAPIFIVFFLGYALKKLNIFKPEDGGLLLKLLFFVVTPALIFLSVQSLKITPVFLFFPIIAAISTLSVYFFGRQIFKVFNLPVATVGISIIGAMIMNTGFALPFIIAQWGNIGVARVAMFDLAGGILTYVFVYALAVKYGAQNPNMKFVLQKILISPPVWALLLALVFNWFKLSIPLVLETTLKNLSVVYSPLVIFALGLYFSPKFIYPKLLLTGLIMRFGIGIFVGLIFTKVFGLTGIDKTIAIICTSAPIGFNTLTFASMEKLDIKFAASLVSVGIAVGLLLIPILIYIGV